MTVSKVWQDIARLMRGNALRITVETTDEWRYAFLFGQSDRTLRRKVHSVTVADQILLDVRYVEFDPDRGMFTFFGSNGTEILGGTFPVVKVVDRA